MFLSDSFEVPSLAFFWLPVFHLSGGGNPQPAVAMVVVETRDDTPEPIRRKKERRNGGEKIQQKKDATD